MDLSGPLPIDFGRFRLTALLGEGGMARVYSAEFTGPAGFRKVAAVKVIRVEAVGGDEARMSALVNEARVGGLLKHPNIVDTYDFGVVDGHPYVAMERIEGVDLARLLLTMGPPPPALACDLFAAICAGLHHAHELKDRGRPLHLVHRDLKPSNVLVGIAGDVKVMDFGLAKATAVDLGTTGTGIAKGTPPYMSPEQLRADPLDRRSDLFALGALGFELITAERFFTQKTTPSLVTAILTVEQATAPPSRLDEADAIAPGIGEVLRRCLRASPSDRWDTADDVRRAVQEVRRGLSTTTTLTDWLAEQVAQVAPTSDFPPVDSDDETARAPVGWDMDWSPVAVPAEEVWSSEHPEASLAPTVPLESVPAVTSQTEAMVATPAGGRSPRALPGVLLALALALGLGALLARSGGGPGSSLHPSTSAVRNLPITPSGLPEGQPTMSPDGRSVVFARLEEGLGRLWRLDLETGRVARLADAAYHAYQPSLAPDGSRLAFRTDGEGQGLYVAHLPADGRGLMRDPRRITDFGFHPDWSPDGDQLVFSTVEYENSADVSYSARDGDLWRVDLEDGSLVKLHDGETKGDANMPDWSPDGAWIAYWGIDAAGRRNVWVVPASGGEPRRLTSGSSLDWNPRWVDGGRALCFFSDRSGAGALWKLPFDPVKGEGAGPPVAVTTGAGGVPGFLSADAAGRRVVFHELSRRWKLYARALEVGTGEPLGTTRALTRGERSIFDASPSPNGDRVVFWERKGSEDLWLQDLATDDAVRLTDDPALDRYPTWSPDGAWISFVSTRGGAWALWLIRPDGADLHEAAADISSTPPRWSPDGARIAAWSPSAQRVVIVTLDEQLAERSREALLIQGQGGAEISVAGWSPDGRRLLLLYEEPFTWKTTYGVYDLEERRTELLDQQDLQWFRWLTDDSLLGAGAQGFARMSWPEGRLEQVYDVPADGQATWSAELSADGSTLVAVRGTETIALRALELSGARSSPSAAPAP